MNRGVAAVGLAALCVIAAACLPKAHELEGKACAEAHPCPSPLVCVDELCLSQSALDGSVALARIKELQLIDVTTRQAIYPYTPMQDGLTMRRSALPAKGVNVLALVEPDRVSNVDFALFGTERRLTTETSHPYFLFGDRGDGGVNAWKPDAGSYRLQVTPFVDGSPGDTTAISFTITPD